MKQFTRDIQLTLIIKLLLLFGLWFVCFKDVEKSPVDTRQWLLGNSIYAEEQTLTSEIHSIHPERL